MNEKLREKLKDEYEIFFKDLIGKRKEFDNPVNIFIRIKGENWKVYPERFNKEELTIPGTFTDQYTRNNKLWEDASSKVIKLDELNPEDTKVVMKEQSYFASSKSRKLPKEIRDILKLINDLPEDDSDKRLVPEGEGGRHVSIQEWKEAAELADTPRPKGESRAVIVDGVDICINAAAAIETLAVFESYRESPDYQRDPRKDGDILYRRCETTHRFQEAIVFYASREDIESKIAHLEGKN